MKHPDPMIFQGTEIFDFSNPPIDPVELAYILGDEMIKENGLGIAAPQLGLPYRAFAIKSNPVIVCFNPRIVYYSEQVSTLEEGCLSYPGLAIKITRPQEIRVRYEEPNGGTVTKEFGGMTARCFQHEMDHLDGISFINRAKPHHKQQAMIRWKKKQRSGELCQTKISV